MTQADDGLTGTDYDRPDFQRMMKDIEEGRVNCVIVKDLSRAFRNYSDQGYFLETFFPKYNIRFITIGTPKIDSYLNPDSISSFDVPITGVMNDRYCKKTSDDIRRTFNTKRRKGEFIGAFAPYGYSKDPQDKNKLIIDEEVSQVVYDIFHWFVDEGMSKRGIAKRLNNLGILNPASYKKSKGMKYSNPHHKFNDTLWSAHSVMGILTNQKYIGDMVQGQHRVISYKIHIQIKTPKEEWFIVEGTHEPIIDQEKFEKAQELQQRDTRIAPQKQELYLFAGFIRCADCKKAMHRKQSGKHIYYFCRTYTDKSKTACTKHTIKLEKLEEAVLYTIRQQIDIAITMAEMIEKINTAPTVKKQSKTLEETIKVKQAELQKITCYKQSLYEDWKNGDITKQDYRNMSFSYDEQLETIQRILDNLKNEQKIVAEGVNKENTFLTQFKKHENITELSRDILVELIDVIYIQENGDITIRFKFADEYKRVCDFIENNRHNLP